MSDAEQAIRVVISDTDRKLLDRLKSREGIESDSDALLHALRHLKDDDSKPVHDFFGSEEPDLEVLWTGIPTGPGSERDRPRHGWRLSRLKRSGRNRGGHGGGSDGPGGAGG